MSMTNESQDTATTEGGTLTEVVELPPVELGPADTVIAGLKNRLQGQKADSPAGYQLVRTGIAECRCYRTDVEGSRKDFKRSALEWGRKVDTEARRVTDLLLEIETPLKEEKARVDWEKERIRKEKAEKIRLAQEAKERAERDAREKEEAAERERVRLQQEAERKRLEAERAELEKQRAKQVALDIAEQEKLNAQRRQLERDRQILEREKQQAADDARKKLEAEEAARQKQRAEQVAREKAEQAKLDAIEEVKEQKAREVEQERLVEERKPDRQKLADFVNAIEAIERPKMGTKWGDAVLAGINRGLGEVILEAREFLVTVD